MSGRGLIIYDGFCVTQKTLTPAVVNASSGGEQTFAFNGLLTTDVVIEVSKAANQAGLAIGSCRVSAANTLAISFINASTANITPTAAEVYTALFFRPEKPPGSADGLSGGNVIF